MFGFFIVAVVAVVAVVAAVAVAAINTVLRVGLDQSQEMRPESLENLWRISEEESRGCFAPIPSRGAAVDSRILSDSSGFVRFLFDLFQSLKILGDSRGFSGILGEVGGGGIVEL